MRHDEEQIQKSRAIFHERAAPIIFLLICELGGYFIKMAQKLAFIPGIMLPPYATACKPLFNDIPARPFETMAAVFSDAVGMTPNVAFEMINPVPLGAASLAQAYRACLSDRFGGDDAVVKIQYPEVGRNFKSDLDNLVLLTRFLNPEYHAVLGNEYQTHVAELDFRNEARHIMDIRLSMKSARFFPKRISIPEVFPMFTTAKTLVMEYLPGKSFGTFIEENLSAFAQALGFENTQALIMHYEKEFYGEDEPDLQSEARIHPQNQCTAAKNALRLGFISLAQYALVLNHVGTLLDRIGTPLKHKVSVFEKLELVIVVHGHQLLIDGFANIDPHSGNIIIMPDGRVGLIDFGQCVKFSSDARRKIAQFLLAIDRDDKNFVVEQLRVDGYRIANSSPNFIYGSVQYWFDKPECGTIKYEDGRLVPIKGNVQRLLRYHRELSIPNYITNAKKLTFTLHGLSKMLGVRTSLVALWKDMALEVVKGTRSKRRLNTKLPRTLLSGCC